MAFNSNPVWGWIGAVFEKDGVEVPLLRLHSEVSIAVCFEYMLGKPLFDDLARRQQLLDRLNAVPGVKLSPDAVSKRKGIQLSAFTPETTADFLGAVNLFVEELRNADPLPTTSAERSPAP